MNNLKRVLSLALASVMLIGMMVVGASATNAEDFTDASEITHTEAVSIATALNIINGKEDGSYFDPTGEVTRAEMAKMITRAMYGGKDPVLGVKATPTFTDIKGNWAESYIEYCASAGIINGRGDGTFDPAGLVTGTEAAKMLLVALGYDTDVYELTGIDWAINVNTEANRAKLYEKLSDIDPNAGLSRDNAAQMLYNGVLAPGKKIDPTLEIKDGSVTYQYTDGPSIFVDRYEGTDNTGLLEGFDYNESKGEWTYDIYLYTDANSVAHYDSVTTTEDFTDYLGEKVRVLYTYDEDENKWTLYGMFTKDTKIIAEGFSGDIVAGTNLPAAADSTLKIGDETYRLDSTANSIPVYYARVRGITDSGYTLNQLNSITGHYTYKLVDYDGNNKVDRVDVTPFYFGKVTYVGKESMTVALQNGDTDPSNWVSGNLKLEDVEVYEGIAKDDYVMAVRDIYAPKEKATFAKATPVSGTISGVKNATSEFKIDGHWYTKVSGNTTTLNSNDTIDYIAFGSEIYYAKVTSGVTGLDALAAVIDIKDYVGTGVAGNYIQAKVITADGTSITGKVAEINGVDVTSKAVGDNITGKDATEGTVTVTGIGASLKGEMVKYEKNSDGNLSLWTIPASYNTAKVLGFDGTLAAGQTFNNTTDKIGTYEVADDAVIFVTRTDAKAKVYTGKELKNTVGNFGSAGITYASGVYGKKNGFTYTLAAVLNGGTSYPTINTGTNYAYLVSDAYTAKESGTSYYYYEFWNGSEVVTAKEKEGSNLAKYAAGVVITYDVSDATADDNGFITVKNVKIPTMGIGTVDGYDGAKKINVSGSGKTVVDDDTVILYVNSKDTKGVSGGDISEAVDLDGDTVKEPNVLFLEGGDKNFAVLVVDVNQKFVPNLAQVQKVLAADTNASSTINTALLTNNVKISTTNDIDFNDGTALLVKEGKTLTIEADDDQVTFTDGVTLEANAKLVVNTTNATGVTFTPALTIDKGASVVVNGKLVLSAGATVGSTTTGETAGSLKATGTTTGDVTVKGTGSAELAAITGDVSVEDTATLSAGKITGTLELKNTAEAVVTELPTSTLTTAVGTSLTVTGAIDISSDVTLANTTEGKLTLTGGIANGGTNHLILDAKSNVVIDTTAIDAKDITGAAGAKLTFKVAPSAVAANDAAGAFYGPAGKTAYQDKDAVKLNVVYTYTAAAGITGTPSNPGWLGAS